MTATPSTTATIEQRAVAETACPACDAQPGSACTRKGSSGKDQAARLVTLAHPHSERVKQLGDKIGTAAQAKASASKAGGKSAAPAAAAALHKTCTRCGYEFKTPRKSGLCNTKTACDKRTAKAKEAAAAS